MKGGKAAKDAKPKKAAPAKPEPKPKPAAKAVSYTHLTLPTTERV